MTLLEHGVDQHQTDVLLMHLDPFLVELRDDPRFQRMIERTGLAR